MTGSQTHKPTNATRASNKAYAIDLNQIAELPDECVSICLTYKQKYALLVQCKYLYWKTRYDNNDGSFDIAAFAAGIETALMSECDCIDCDYMRDCLQPLFDAITQQLNRIEYGYNEKPGNQLPPDKLQGNMAGSSNPTCDYDILWAQCIQLIEMTNDFITDVLERIESATNAIDAAEVIGGLPFIDEFGGDSIQAYVQILNEGIAESYASQYTVTLRDEMACALFCMCKGDCTISIERINRVFVNYLKDEFGDAPSLFANISALMSYLIDGSIESDIVVYAMYMLWWGVVGVGGTLAGLEQSNYTLAVILQLAADDPSPDWEVLCAECPEEKSYLWDFADLATFSDLFINVGSWFYAPGVGLHTDQPSQTFVFGYGYLDADRITAGVSWSRIVYTFVKTAGGSVFATDDIFVNGDAYYQEYNPAGEYNIVIDGDWTSDGINPLAVGIGYYQPGGGALTIKSVKITWVGVEQPGLAGGEYV